VVLEPEATYYPVAKDLADKEIENVVTTNDELYRAFACGHMFARRTYCEDMSKKSAFLNMSVEAF